MASGDKTYLADKQTLDAINNKVDALNTNVNAVKSDVGTVKSNTDTTNTRIGTSSDAASAATLFGRIKELFAALGTNSDSSNTSGTTLFAKIKGLISLIGAYNATSSSSGTTLFAKLNYLVGWATSARGTKIDNIGTTSDSAGTATSGTLFGKSRKIIESIGQASDTGATASSGTLMGKVNGVLGSMQSGLPGTVKQIAFGTYTTSGTGDSEVTITTGITVVPEKTLIFLNNGLLNRIKTTISSVDVTVSGAVITEKTATTFTMTKNTSDSGGGNKKVSWQLMEFY